MGDELGATVLEFTPRRAVRAGDYFFDVGQAREGGSAGAASLIAQAILLPLMLAAGCSGAIVRGGTHMAWSPPFDYLRDVWLATLARLGATAQAELGAWGFFPVGRGEIRLAVEGLPEPAPPPFAVLDATERGALIVVRGRAVAANLPAHIAQRMTDRARALLEAEGFATRIEARRVSAACPGAGLFLTAEYNNALSGFSALGARGKPAEAVAGEAVAALLAHHATGAAVDRHLADQLIAPLAFADGPSRFTVATITKHLETNIWVVERFGLAHIALDEDEQGRHVVTVAPRKANASGG